MIRRRDDDGSVTLWSLGLAVIVLLLGSLSLDLWAVLAARQELVAIADALAVAAASGIDEGQLRANGVVALDPAEAEVRARRALARQDRPVAWRSWDLEVAGSHVTVTIDGHVDGVVLRLLGFDGLDLAVRSASAPLLLP